MDGSDDNDEFYMQSLPDKVIAELSGVVQQQAQMLSDAQHAVLQSLEETEPTGDLAASCVIVQGDSPTEWIVQAGGELTTKEVREGSGVTYDYATAFEFGTTKQHAKPFFWPTYHAKRDQIRQAIADGVEKALNE